MHASFFYGEWPARLRLLWLRGIGDRSGGWRLVERLLRQDALLVGAITSVIAIAALLLSAVAPLYLALYVAGCVTTIFVASYLEFWMRLQGVSRPAKLLISLLASALPLALLVFAISSEHPGRIAWLLPLSIAGGMGVRGLAMRQTYRVDWCAVRPLRWIRRSV
jgi:hypothetical protein